MRDRLEVICERYNQITELLADPNIVSDIKKLTELSKEQRQLEKPVQLFREQEQLIAYVPELKEMKKSDDPEMAEMAEKTFHSTTIQAATVAKDAGVKKLIVGHYSSRFPSVDFYLDEIQTIFPEASLAHDGDVIEI